jgi:hypothetical protein
MSHLNDVDSERMAESPRTWPLFGRQFPRSEIVYLTQIILIYGVVIVSMLNLTLYTDKEEHKTLWVSLLSGCLGYILPNPNIKKK